MTLRAKTCGGFSIQQLTKALNRDIIRKTFRKRGESLKKTKRRRKLLIQTAMIIIPVFMLMIAAVAQTVYISSVNSYLEGQKIQIEDMMNTILTSMIIKDINTDDYLWDWTVEQLEKMPEKKTFELTEEEHEQYLKYFIRDDRLEKNWYEEMPYDIRNIWMRDTLGVIDEYIDQTVMRDSLGGFFIIDAENPGQARAIFDMDDKSEYGRTGGYYDLDISRYPVLQQALVSDSEEMMFEKVKDFPSGGYYYWGYRSAVVNGKTIAVFGIAYDWEDLRQSVVNTMINTVIIIVIGMILLMTMLLLFLYFRAIRPSAKIQKALSDYAADKNTPLIVKKMYDIKADNELGYLADTISDLALEIEHYTNENIRIAVAKERTEKELYEAKVAVMASQIRPHFMYNALTSIAMMCTIDPETAQEATVTFAKYLRENMDSLKQKAPVPFVHELEHLKKYLYIEKLRFGKKLNIEYDIQADDFVIPLLSVQPLVENAVKHGVGMKKKGGTVKISSRETDTAFEVIISDDGVGFDTSAERKDDGRSHVGMENTRTRLKEMCGGEVIIESTVGEGTAARIILPKEGQNRENTVS